MPKNNKLAPHEILELREMMSTEVLAIKKTQASLAMVKDLELKSFMERCLDAKQTNLSSMQSFVENNQM